MKHISIWLLLCILAVTMFSSCSKKNKGAAADSQAREESVQEEEVPLVISENGAVPIVNERLSFDVLCPAVSNIPDIETNAYVLWLEEKTNVHIEYELVAESLLKEKTDRILAAGLYPDAFLDSSISVTEQVHYGSMGAFLDLKPYYEKYGYYINAAYAATDYLPRTITTTDGKIYCMMGVDACEHRIYPGRAWINKLWLDDLQMSMPRTVEDLEKVLTAFRDTDCNGNGDPSDEIPMIGSADIWGGRLEDWLLESWFYDDYEMQVEVRDGHVVYGPTSDAYRKGVAKIRDWTAKGLIDEAFLSISAEDLKALGTQEYARIGVMTGSMWYDGVGIHQVEDPNGLWRDWNYTALPNVKGPNGERNTLTENEGVGSSLIISSTCPNPEVLFRWGDYQMSEEASIRSYAGSYELHVSEPDPDALGIDKKPAVYKVTSGPDSVMGLQNENCDNFALAYKSARILLGQQTDWDDPETPYDTEPRLFLTVRNRYSPNDASEKRVPTLVMNEEDASLRMELEPSIKEYARTWFQSFVLGEKDLKTDWEAYIQGFEELRLDEYMALLDKYYQQEYGRS